jgi:hypothetical protein
MNRLVFLMAVAGVFCAGCAKSPPPVTQLDGEVLLDGQPLPFAQITFVPDLEHFGAEMNSAGQSDEKGRFTLTCAHKNQPGAVVAKHRVLVAELPTPAEYRKPDGDTQARYANYLATLKNRPIPAEYAVVSRTPLLLEVTEGQKSYKLELQRKS